MGEFKCNSGISSDSNEKNINKENNYNDRDNVVTGAAAATAAGTASQYTKSKTESDYNDNLSGDKTSQYTKSKSASNTYDPSMDLDSSDGCGCSTSGDDFSGGYNDDLQDTGDGPTATIYSETIIFADPYADVNDQEATSDLKSDAEEGSEYISDDANSRPRC